MVRTFNILKMLFINISFNNDIIYIICEYTGKKWIRNTTKSKQIKVKNCKGSKQRYSIHYYNNK
jgi:hypothetical protein